METSRTTTRTMTIIPTTETAVATPMVNNVPSEQVKNAIRLLDEEGNIQKSAITPQMQARFQELTKNLVLSDSNSISNYGTDLQSAMQKFSTQYLAKVRTCKTGELGAQMTELLTEIDGVDIDGIKDSSFVATLRKIPILNLLAPSINKRLIKYDTVNGNIERLEKKITASRLCAEADNNALETMFDENVVTLKRLEETIVAGKLKLEELKGELAEMENNRQAYDDYQIQDQQQYIIRLEKRIGDLFSQYHLTQVSLPQIRVVQYNNTDLADNARTLISLTVPSWRSQLAFAVCLNNQKKSAAIQRSVREAFNNSIRTNADMVYENTIAVAKETNAQVADVESIKYATAKLIDTLKEQKELQLKGVELRKEAERELLKIGEELARNMTEISQSTSQQYLTR